VQQHLVIFAKEPRLNKVKTRLARDIGRVAAWRFYRSMLYQMPRRLSNKGPWKTWLSFSPDQALKKTFNVPGVSFMKQGTGDLGQRMLAPKDKLPPGAFVVIGSDIPEIKPDHIRKAFDLLGHNDVVFGPSNDGGFWLVGLKRHPIVTNPYAKAVRWSHEETLNDCLANLKGAKVGFLETLPDIDTGEDLRRWRQNR